MITGGTLIETLESVFAENAKNIDIRITKESNHVQFLIKYNHKDCKNGGKCGGVQCEMSATNENSDDSFLYSLKIAINNLCKYYEEIHKINHDEQNKT